MPIINCELSAEKSTRLQLNLATELVDGFIHYSTRSRSTWDFQQGRNFTSCQIPIHVQTRGNRQILLWKGYYNSFILKFMPCAVYMSFLDFLSTQLLWLNRSSHTIHIAWDLECYTFQYDIVWDCSPTCLCIRLVFPLCAGAFTKSLCSEHLYSCALW